MSMSGDVFSDPGFEAGVVNQAIASELGDLHGEGVAFEDMPGDPRLQRLGQFVSPELAAASAEYDDAIAPVIARLRADEAALIESGIDPKEAKRIIQGRLLEAFVDVHTKEQGE